MGVAGREVDGGCGRTIVTYQSRLHYNCVLIGWYWTETHCGLVLDWGLVLDKDTLGLDIPRAL